MIPVRTGQVYTEGGARPALWEVVQVIAPPTGLTHVRLRERASRRRMLLSCRALFERFRLHTVKVPVAPAHRVPQPITALEDLLVPPAPVPLVPAEAARREVA